MRIFDSTTIQILQKALDAAALRQQVIAHNIANINTPGYRRATVSFEESLRTALAEKRLLGQGTPGPRKAARPDPVERVQPQVVREPHVMRTDGSGIDIEREMAELAANTINYNAATQMLNGKFGALKYVINEGRR